MVPCHSWLILINKASQIVKFKVKRGQEVNVFYLFMEQNGNIVCQKLGLINEIYFIKLVKIFLYVT